MTEPHDYRITVQRRETEDGLLFEGTVYEFPHVTVYGDTFEEAYELATDAVEGLCELALEQGDAVPVPTERKTEFSGKFVVRVPKSLHRNLVCAAAEENTSLNQYVISVLSAHAGVANVQTYAIGVTVPAETKDITWVSSGSVNIHGIARDFRGGSNPGLFFGSWAEDTSRDHNVEATPMFARQVRA